MILLDTTAAIFVLRGDIPPAQVENESFGVSTIVELELWLGVLHGGGEKERRRVTAFLQEAVVFPFDRQAATSTAEVLSELWKSGKPIGDFDSQIAGHAIALDLPLLTDNTRHFKRVRGLTVVAWRGSKE